MRHGLYQTVKHPRLQGRDLVICNRGGRTMIVGYITRDPCWACVVDIAQRVITFLEAFPNGHNGYRRAFYRVLKECGVR